MSCSKRKRGIWELVSKFDTIPLAETAWNMKAPLLRDCPINVEVPAQARC